MTTSPSLSHAAAVVAPSAPSAWHPRTALELASQQLAAIETFHRVRRTLERAEAATARTRELRLDAARRMDVLRRQHAALVARTHEQLCASGEVLGARPARSVMLAHRDEWFVDRVAGGLAGAGVQVCGRWDNGADAVGAAVADQPDLLLVEDTLAMVNGPDVVREVLQYCPTTQVVAQVAYADRIGVMLDAGASAVWTRRTSPAEVVMGMRELLELAPA